MHEGYTPIDDKWYYDYLEDVEIAKKEIMDMKLYPRNGILGELYALPSLNNQTYYALIYEDERLMKMVYAKPQIQVWHFTEPITMYSFKDVKMASHHLAYVGKIIVGMKQLEISFINLIMDIFDSIPKSNSIWKNECYIDGVIQAISVYRDGKKVKNCVYRDADAVELPKDKAYLQEELRHLFQTVERIIG